MPPQVPGKARQVMAQKILQQSREAESALADALVSLPPGGGVLVSTYHLVHVHLNITILSKFANIRLHCYIIHVKYTS